MIVPRTVTAVGSDDKPARTGAKLSDFRDERFYVLLGSPGAGKTTAFEAEALRSDESLYLTAREVARAHSHPKSKWRGKTLFIDGLDEVRAGKQDVREPLDSILDCLDRLGGPPARLSCRSAAWLATNDREAIRSIPGYGRLTILQLDPLTEENARDILGHRLGSAALDFFESANSRMLHGLLDNPLTLELLMKATGEGCEWPASRVDTFERACLALTTEENDEHRAALRYPTVRENLSPTRVLDAASRIAALYLLTDKDGIAWDRSDVADPESVLLINEAPDFGGELTRRAWESGLFSQRTQPAGSHHDILALVDDDTEQSVPPVDAQLPAHEHVAEYLAARHLNKVLAGGAVLRRVLSLLTIGSGVPSPLRGVAAWLAALCPDARQLLMNLDPVGMVAYGDIGVFDEDGRTYLLERLLVHDGPSSDALPGAALVGFVSPRTMNDLQDYMAGSDRSKTVQKAVKLLLRGVAAAPSLCSGQFYGKDLLAVVRDDSWSSAVRYSALVAAIEFSSDQEEVTMRLELLQDVNAGDVDDPVGDLRVSLFRDLYPSHLSPEKAWDYLPIPVDPAMGYVLSQSSPKHCCQLLDALHARMMRSDDMWDLSLRDLTWELIARAIQVHGNSVGVAKLYDWVELAAFDWDCRMWVHVRPDIRWHALWGSKCPVDTVQQWLADHPGFQKELLVAFLRRHEQEVGRASQVKEYWRTVSRAGQPKDFHEWCFQQALAMSADFTNAAQWLVMFAVEPDRRTTSPDEWLPIALQHVNDDPVLVDQLRELAELDAEDRRRKIQYRTRRANREANWRATLANMVLEHRDTLLKGTGPENLLASLGEAYLGNPGDDPANGTERLCAALASNEDATEVALRALARIPTSGAGPGIPEIMKLDGEGRFSGWALPFLAGLDVMERRGDHIPDVLGKEFERALWFYLAMPQGDREMPAWFAAVLESHPGMVATIIVKLHRNRIRSKIDTSVLLQDVVFGDRWRHAARLALPELLKAFPAKGNGDQLPLLRQVLVAAIRYVPEEVPPRVRNRMAVRNMNAAQRITWMGAGVAVAPDEFAPAAVDFVEDGKDARRKHLVDTLYAIRKAYDSRPLFDAATEAEAKAVASLVDTLGLRYPPYWSGLQIETAGPSLVDDASSLVEHMIECLAKNPTRAAGLELDRLSNDSSLTGWHSALKDALERQQALHYRTEHRVPTVKEVERVLRDGLPANAADLAALVVDRMECLGRDIRDSSTDAWQQYWNEGRGKDTERHPPWPKEENHCRNALLFALDCRLPSEVDARREPSYAEETRADIRVYFDSHAIPIEIKKSSNREVWSAMRNQLMKKYVRDPESAGYGIYVVLWFGAGGPERVKTPPKGPRPKDPEELARRLEEELSDDERHRVKVVVIDVSRPEST